MQTCDVLVVGGGPAGAACAWKLRRAGADVLVVDRAAFPRDKPCAGWVTPPALEAIEFDPDEYTRGRTLQPFTGFRVGLIASDDEVAVGYGRPVSYGIRRTEFDHYLLMRSGARIATAPVTSLRRDDGDLVVNEEVRTRLVVGAGGHACPVAAWLSPESRHRPPFTLVLAQQTEFPIDRASAGTRPDVPELFFSRDLGGYGWCVRKGDYLNVGYGHHAGDGLPRATHAFAAYLERRGKVARGRAWRWQGWAYRLAGGARATLVGDGVLLVGDAAGCAYPSSGEGIRPAIESGLMAADAIIAAGGRRSRADLEPYERRARARFTPRPWTALSMLVPRDAAAALTRRLLSSPWFVRRVIMDRLFLHASDAPVHA